MKRLSLMMVLLATAFGLIAVPSASATSVSGLSLSLFTNQPSNVVTAGSAGSLKASFIATNALQPGDTVTITGPAGTDFSGLVSGDGSVTPVNTLVNVSTNPPSSDYFLTPSVSNGGKTLMFALPDPLSVGAGQQLDISLSFTRYLIDFGTSAGTKTMAFSTSKDMTPVNSPSYAMPAAAPVAPVAADSPLSATVGTSFGTMHVGLADQYGNPVSGQVTATVASSGPSGTFAGDAGKTVTTNSSGAATLPALTASPLAGAWQLDLSGPGGLHSQYQLTNNTDVPASLIAVDGIQETPHDTQFAFLDVKVADQYGNGISGQTVTTILPSTGASGTFPGGALATDVTTDSDGDAVLPMITANGQIGPWTAAMTVPGGLTGSYEMINLAHGEPASVALALSPTSITADGSSKVAATATVTDSFGNKVSDEDVAITSSGAQQIGAVTDNGDGTYTAQITSTTTPGASTITATDNDAQHPTGTATLTQTARPATTARLSLSPTSIKADGTSTTTATVTLSNAADGPVPGDHVEITSTGSQKIGAVTDKGNGTYTATITSSKTVGDSAIKATDTSVTPQLSSAAVTLTQTAADGGGGGGGGGGNGGGGGGTSVKPKLKFVHPPKKKVKSAKVKSKFKVVKGKAKSFQCKIDKKKWAKCKSPKKVKLKKGKHVFKVRGIATDGTPGKAIIRKIKRV